MRDMTVSVGKVLDYRQFSVNPTITVPDLLLCSLEQDGKVRIVHNRPY